MKKLKISIAEPIGFKNAVSVIAELINEAKIEIDKDKLSITAIDPACVGLVVWEFYSSACVEWNCDKQKIWININTIKRILKNLKNDDILEIQYSKKDKKLDFIIRNKSKRNYTVPLMEELFNEIEEPQLKFTSSVIMDSGLFSEQIKESQSIGCSCLFEIKDKHFSIKTQYDDDDELSIENNDNDSIIIEGKGNSKFSVEYLEKFTRAKSISSNVKIEVGNDYPLRLTYTQRDKQELRFILAPRTER